MITEKETALVKEALDIACSKGADKARATLFKSMENMVATLNGEIDRVTLCADTSLSMALFVDGRFGSFSTNKLDSKSLEEFIEKSIGIVRMLGVDRYRDLPSPDRCCKTAVTGNELDLVDSDYDRITPQQRLDTAKAASAFPFKSDRGFEVISEEAEYSDSIYDTVVMDTNGLCCRHSETCFDYGVEVTIEDTDGEKYSGYWWDSSSKHDSLKSGECCRKAIERAAANIGAEAVESGRYNMVIDSETASKVVSPVLRALSAYSIQQSNSFLKDSKDKKVFPEGMSIMDMPHIPGQTCSKLFDSEGVATKETPIIENGVVKQYFVNTYMANKLQVPATIEDATRPKVMPWPTKGLSRDDIMSMCGSGILVTDFNGGNSNSATGDFSYGVEGFWFENGKIVKPVSEMVVTGNFLTLWNNLIAAGDDSRSCMSKLIPTLAFSNVDFNG